VKRILVLGAGEIGLMISYFLAKSGKYQVMLGDVKPLAYEHEQFLATVGHLSFSTLDVSRHKEMHEFLSTHDVDAVVSCLPYFMNVKVAELAKEHQLHYFDLTEDVATVKAIEALAIGGRKAFVPQCGLAPGLIDVVAVSLAERFSEIDSIKLRVGALPENINNALQYALTWSIDGLINEYGNPCLSIKNGECTSVQPLEDLEEVKLDGVTYEAFNTSGGVANLVSAYAGKVRSLNYKTLRYPGHCEKMRFLMRGLKLNQDRDTLKRILQNALPKTRQDVVLVYASVTGKQHDELIEEHYYQKYYPQKLDGVVWSSIQVTTASQLCCVLDLVLSDEQQYHGLVYQEQFALDDVLQNEFGIYLRDEKEM